MMARPRREPGGLGLRPRADGLGARIRTILGRPRSGATATWEALEEALVAGDIGAVTALELVDAARERIGPGNAASADQIREALANEIVTRLAAAGGASFEIGPPPSVVLVVGVNGTGKTTTIAKLAALLHGRGHTVLLAAADTYRAAAIEQLRLWADQVGVPVIAQRPGADPAAVAFDAVASAEARGTQVVLIDTAGRLHSKTQLMAELAKIRGVIERRLPGQPRHVLLVLDATTGQNGLLQAQAFSREAGVTGIVLTKLDGSAKGGVAVAIAVQLELPIYFVGVGEQLTDLAPFDARSYVDWLLAG